MSGDQPIYDHPTGGKALQRADLVGFHQTRVTGDVGR